MRIPVNNVFRAFPELDRFSDATCLRFVDLAKRRWALRRWAWATLAVGAFAGAFSVLSTLFYVVLAAFAGSGGPSEFLVMAGVAFVFGAASIIGLSVRDFGLRQLLRHHITGASCPTCGYKLLGLAPIGGGVRCPECGLVVMLSELGMTAEELLVGARTDAAPVAPVLIEG